MNLPKSGLGFLCPFTSVEFASNQALRPSAWGWRRPLGLAGGSCHKMVLSLFVFSAKDSNCPNISKEQIESTLVL